MRISRVGKAKQVEDDWFLPGVTPKVPDVVASWTLEPRVDERRRLRNIDRWMQQKGLAPKVDHEAAWFRK